MMFSEQKSSFLSLVHRTGILRKHFWSSLFNTEFTNSEKEGEFDLYHTYYPTAHKLHSLCQSPYGIHFLLGLFCANCLRTSLPLSSLCKELQQSKFLNRMISMIVIKLFQ